MTLAVSAVIIEILTVIFAGFVICRRWGCTFAEAGSYAVISCMMIFSFLFQTAFIIGMPFLSFPAEIILVGASVRIIYTSRNHLADTWQYIREFAAFHPVVAAVCGAGVGYLAALAILIPPVSGEWAELSRAAVFHRNNSFFVQNSAAEFLPLYPVNSLVLPYLFLRFNSDSGVGLLGFMAYISIGFSTYALSRRYSWPPMAFTVTMMVMSMPRLVLLASSPGQEIIPAAVSVFCILAITRSVEQPDIRDFILLIAGVCFSISGQMMCLVFPLVLLCLSGFIFFRRHGASAVGAMIRNNRRICFLSVPMILIFSQVWLFAYNFAHFGTWLVQPADFVRNTGELKGALANMTRYLFESAHMTHPFHLLTKWTFGLNIPGALQGFADRLLRVFFENIGTSAPFRIEWIPDPQMSWFGPVSFFLIIPAVLFGMIRGQRRIKTVSLGLLSYAILVSLIAAWKPGNAGYFTVFFVCGGYLAAFFLPPWRITRTGKRALQAVSLLLFFYFSFFNFAKPLLTYSFSFQNNIWKQTGWGSKRFSTAAVFFNDNRVTECAGRLKPDSCTVIVYKNESRIYPFIAASEHTRFILAPYSRISGAGLTSSGADQDNSAQSLSESGLKRIAASDLLKNADYLLFADISETELTIPEELKMIRLAAYPDTVLFEVGKISE